MMDEYISTDVERKLAKPIKVKHYFDTSEERLYQWKRGVTTGTHDETFREYMVMKEMHWSWEDLENIPEIVYLSFNRIMGFEAKERERESKNAKSGMGIRSQNRRF